MLNFFFLKLVYINYIKNNFYLDYALKFIISTFVYQVYVNIAYFFAEKYIIEYSTKYVFNYTSLMFYKSAHTLNNAKLASYLLLFTLNTLLVLI